MRTGSLKRQNRFAVPEPSVHVGAPAITAASVLAAMAMRPYVAAWCEMLLVAMVLFANFKCLTWTGRAKRFANAGRGQALAYFFGWVGLDVDEFCTRLELDSRPPPREWAAAAAKTLLGAAVLWGLVRLLPA